MTMDLIAEVSGDILSKTLDLSSRVIDIAMKGQIRSNTKGNNVRAGHGRERSITCVG